MGLTDQLQDGVVCVDTQVIIYLIEKHPVFAPPLQPLAKAIQSGAAEVWASELVMMESLILPIRLGDTELTARFNTLFTRSKLRRAPISRDVL